MVQIILYIQEYNTIMQTNHEILFLKQVTHFQVNGMTSSKRTIVTNRTLKIIFQQHISR